MTNINFSTSSDNSLSETELLNFSILKPFDMEPMEKVTDQNYAQY